MTPSEHTQLLAATIAAGLLANHTSYFASETATLTVALRMATTLQHLHTTATKETSPR